jgi:type IV pilus assembly protein PilF
MSRTAFPAAALLVALFSAACTTTSTETRTPAGASSAPPPPARERATSSSDEGDSARRARTRLELAAAYFSRGQLDVALDEVKRALQADPNNAGAFNLRGLIQAGQGDDAAAEESFRRAIQLDARGGEAMSNYGWFLCQRRRYAEATTQFDQALGVPGYRDVPRTLLAKGVCLAFDKRYAEAESTLSRAQQLDPTNPAIATNLAEVLYRLGQYPRARDTIRRVNNMAGVANAQTLWLAARIERRLGNNPAVADLGQRLTSQFPDSPEADAFAKGRWSE